MHPRAKERVSYKLRTPHLRGKGRRDLKTGNARESGLLQGRVEGRLGLDVARERELSVLCRKGEQSFRWTTGEWRVSLGCGEQLFFSI